MKKLFVLLLIITFAGIFAQEKRVDFSKKLVYTFKAKERKDKFSSLNSTPNFNIINYVSKNNELFTVADIMMYKFNIFSDKEISTLVNVEFNNRLSASSLFTNVYRFYGDENEMSTQKYAASKLNKTETILGITCNQYILKPVFVQDSPEVDKDKDNLKVCINENYGLNNFPIISSVFNVLQPNKKIEFNISGLILKAGAEKDYDEEYFTLKSAEDSKDFVYFDVKKALIQNKKASDSINEVRKQWQKLYASDSAVAAVDSTAVVDTAYADVDYYKIPDYISNYKKGDPQMANLSIDNPDSKKLFNGIPKHCVNIEKELPVFENKDIKKHLKNYVGQMCDMYLTQSEAETVDEKGTLDEIRREVLYLINVKEKLSEKDKKKLDKYLDNLD